LLPGGDVYFFFYYLLLSSSIFLYLHPSWCYFPFPVRPSTPPITRECGRRCRTILKILTCNPTEGDEFSRTPFIEFPSLLFSLEEHDLHTRRPVGVARFTHFCPSSPTVVFTITCVFFLIFFFLESNTVRGVSGILLLLFTPGFPFFLPLLLWSQGKFCRTCGRFEL